MSLTTKRIEVMARELAACSAEEVSQAIKAYAPEERISIKHAIHMQREAQGITLDGVAEVPGRRLGEQDGSYWLRRMNIHGPLTQEALESKMAAAGLSEPRLHIECKLECMERGWLLRGLGYDEAGVNHGPEPLSVEMRALYRRAGLQADRTYTQQEVDQALWNSDLTTMHRMAVRQELHTRRQIRASALNVLGERLAALRELQRQRPSMEGKGMHTMQASAEPTGRRRGAVLTDPRTGRPTVLTFLP
jgi:hypothetical protein